MYLQQITIGNLKRIRDLTLTIPDIDGRPRPWTVIIGENGTAKTSILQAIALTAAGATQANAVMERGVDLLRDRRTPDAPMTLSSTFRFSQTGQRRRDVHPLLPTDRREVPPSLRSDLRLDPRSTTFFGRAHYLDAIGQPMETGDPLERARAVHAPTWFVAGYGVSRVLPDSSLQPDLSKRSVERLRPLFDQRGQLASVGFANHFRKRDAETGERSGTWARRFGKVLNNILKAGGDDLMPGVRGLELRGHGGTRTAADLIDADRFKTVMGTQEATIAGVALSHGFQSTFAWIADLVGHVLLDAETDLPSTSMEGLVLIDEIDLYLHPRWQASFLRALRRVFPRMQFIVTTHSPVVLAGLEPSEIVRLDVDPASGDVRQVARHPETGDLVPVADLPAATAEPDPRAMTGTEIYEDYFGIHRLTLHPQGGLLREYLALSGDPLRTDAQQARVDRLERELTKAGVTSLPAATRREAES